MSLEKFHNLPQDKQNQIIKKGIEVFSQTSFTEASTDLITKEAGISKGLLFHYFGSKKIFYLYLLEYCIVLLTTSTANTEEKEKKDFYDLLFDSMDKKMKLQMEYPKEVLFVNQAAKETNKQIAAEKQALIGKYMIEVQKNSSMVLNQAVATLSLRTDVDKQKLIRGLSMYVNTIIMQYLQIYKDKPFEFYNNSESIKMEIKDYIDLILHGVEEDKHD